MPVDSGNPSQQPARPDASAATGNSASGNSASGNSTSPSLLARLRNEEDLAWNELVVLYGPLVHCWCRSSPISEQEISDIVQEVFRAVWTNIDRFRTDRAGDTFRGWLRTITRNKIADFYRREGQSPAAFGGTDAQLRFMTVPDVAPSDNDDDQTVGIRAAEHALFHRALELIRKDFESRTWQAFWRVVVDERSPSEVAEELGMRPGTVRVAKSRVLQRLRQKLGDVAS